MLIYSWPVFLFFIPFLCYGSRDLSGIDNVIYFLSAVMWYLLSFNWKEFAVWGSYLRASRDSAPDCWRADRTDGLEIVNCSGRAGLSCFVITDPVRRGNLDSGHSWVAPVREGAGLEPHTQTWMDLFICFLLLFFLAVSLLWPLSLIELHSPITSPRMHRLSCATDLNNLLPER